MKAWATRGILSVNCQNRASWDLWRGMGTGKMIIDITVVLFVCKFRLSSTNASLLMVGSSSGST